MPLHCGPNISSQRNLFSCTTSIQVRVGVRESATTTKKLQIARSFLLIILPSFFWHYFEAATEVVPVKIKVVNE